MIEILRDANRCDTCVYATVVTHGTDDVPKRAYCPFAGCIYTGGETHMHRLFGACISEKGGENGSKQR